MNLVAKEFVASRLDEDGVLVLSEFAGAASELAGAISVNPYDVEGTAQRLSAARSRCRAPSAASGCARCASASAATTSTAGSTSSSPRSTRPRRAPRRRCSRPSRRGMRALAAELRGKPLLLLVDYDGTLVPLVELPVLASPGEDVRDLLRALARQHAHRRARGERPRARGARRMARRPAGRAARRARSLVARRARTARGTRAPSRTRRGTNRCCACWRSSRRARPARWWRRRARRWRGTTAPPIRSSARARRASSRCISPRC